MRLRNHTYIDDGIMYMNYVTDANGSHWRMSQLYEMWMKKRAAANDPIRTVMSFDDGYVVNNIVDLKVAGAHDVMLMTTESNRKMWCGPDTEFLTVSGYKKMRDIGMGESLVVMDNYKNYYGDTIKLDSDGNSRARALLRNHRVEFVIDGHNGTLVGGDKRIFVMEWDTDDVTIVDNGDVVTYTYGINNYREGLKKLFGLPDYTTDRVVGLKPKVYRKYLIAVYVDGPQNVVLTNGLVVRSTQTEVRSDW